MGDRDWMLPIGEGVCVDGKKGLWSDSAFFGDEDIPIVWYPAEPAPHVQDREVWKRWREFLEASPSVAADSLLTVAKTRARANAVGGVLRPKHELSGGVGGTEAVRSDESEAPAFPNWRFAGAMQFAFGLHCRQIRKGTSIPYIAHLLGVCALVLEAGGDEDQAVASLLNDAVEDQGGLSTLDTIHRVFGERVALAVESCSDTVSNPVEKLPWRERKEKYLAHLRGANQDALIVAAADKLHNARAVLSDCRDLGESLRARFNACGQDQL